MSELVKANSLRTNVITLEVATSNDKPLIIAFDPDGYTEDGSLLFSHATLLQLVEAYKNFQHVNKKDHKERGIFFMVKANPSHTLKIINVEPTSES